MANPIVTITMENGDVMKAELYPEIAPITVENFVNLVKDGFYDGLTFHRIINGFMIQGGCPLGTGTGGCICNENGVIYGKDSFAGEFHKLPFINFSNGKMDNMGDYASMTALINIYNDKVDENVKVRYGHEVCNKYFEGDNTAKETVDQWINYILVQLITITVFYNPEVICIGGGISEEEWFINRIKEKYREECIRHTECDVITTKIDRCKYNNDANILGAVINAIKK